MVITGVSQTVKFSDSYKYDVYLLLLVFLRRRSKGDNVNVTDWYPSNVLVFSYTKRILLFFLQRYFGEGVEKLVLPRPVITQSLQIKLWTNQETSICLKAQVYGCEDVPQGEFIVCRLDRQEWNLFKQNISRKRFPKRHRGEQ